ncbi:MAG: ATP-binding protein [Paludibacter sp.]|jgi:PAS domain S-box-containing protein
MMELDLRTLYLSFTIFLLISLFILIIIWFQTRKRLQGVGFLILCLLSIFIGDGLIFLRGQIPDFISIVVSNSMIVVGGALSYIGVERFNHKRSSNLKFILVFCIFIIIQYFFYAIQPDLTSREINVSAALGIITGFNVWLSIIKLKRSHDQILKAYGIANILFTITSIYRIFHLILYPEIHSDFFKPGTLELTSILVLYGLCLLLLFFLILMINKRLVDVVQSQEDKFYKAFHYAPFSMCITRISDGKIMEVNEYFENCQGRTMDDIEGQSTISLGIWLSENDRTSFIQSLKNGQTKNLQYHFRRKNGDTFLGELSAQTFIYNDEECLISVIIDITEKTKANKLLKDSQQLLKKFAAQLQSAVEEEKVMLANQIDNELNQNLAALKIDLGHFKNKLNEKQLNDIPTEISKKIDDVYSILGNSLRSSLKIMNSLRNEVLYIMGFLDAVELYVDEFSKTNHIKCLIETNISKLTLNPQQSTPLFRVFENAMSNIAEHSKATEVKIRIETIENRLRMEIIDNGIGFSYKPSKRYTSKGLMFMQERIHLLDGNMQIETAPGKGTKIMLEVPVDKKSYTLNSSYIKLMPE